MFDSGSGVRAVRIVDRAQHRERASPWNAGHGRRPRGAAVAGRFGEAVGCLAMLSNEVGASSVAAMSPETVVRSSRAAELLEADRAAPDRAVGSVDAWSRTGSSSRRPGFVRTINPDIKVAFANNVHRIRLGGRSRSGTRRRRARPRSASTRSRRCGGCRRGATPQDPGRELEAHGWQFDEAMPWMAARIDRIAWPETPPGLPDRTDRPTRRPSRDVRAGHDGGVRHERPEQHAMNSLAAAVGYAPDAAVGAVGRRSSGTAPSRPPA